jgi:hypothetical protein
MIPDDEWKTLVSKIEKEFPIRIKLATLAGREPINVKSYKALEKFDDTIAELFLEIALNKPDRIGIAMLMIKDLRK